MSNDLLYRIQEAAREKDLGKPGAAERLKKLISQYARSSPSRLSKPQVKGTKTYEED